MSLALTSCGNDKTTPAAAPGDKYESAAKEAAAGSQTDSDGDGIYDLYDPDPTVAKAPEPPPPPPPPLPPKVELRNALEALDVGARVESSSSALLVIGAETPEGGLQGPSTRDLNDLVGGLFRAVYESGYTRPTTIVFRGGLVSTKTGRDLPEEKTGQYEISRAEAADVNWSNGDEVAQINWALYRTFAHPALKQDDD